jgi:hypothetical protein
MAHIAAETAWILHRLFQYDGFTRSINRRNHASRSIRLENRLIEFVSGFITYDRSFTYVHMLASASKWDSRDAQDPFNCTSALNDTNCAMIPA